MKTTRLAMLAVAISMALATPAAANGEVNVYSYRQPFLVEPLFDAFERETGITVNVVFAKEGLVERLKAEGANSPADVILTTDIGRLSGGGHAGPILGHSGRPHPGAFA